MSEVLMPDRERASLPDAPPVLLNTPAYYGTLSAVRCLGRAGIRVTTAGPSRLAVSAWSKYAARHVSAPGTDDPEAFLDWLKDFGRGNERHVLLPTCDDTAWLFSRDRDELAKYFHLAAPPIETMHALLNKQLLADHARAVGLQVPRTWYPQAEAELTAIAREARFPVLIKPCTQVLFRSHNKGLRVERPENLANAYRSFAGLDYAKPILAHDEAVTRPMVQEFYSHASTDIYNISGFVRNGRLDGARAGRKVLQHPRRIGVGVCFEESAVDPDTATALERLAGRLQFEGVFEAEFIDTPEGKVLIDFNPRFYNQMQFDVARGLPLPTLAYLRSLPAALLASPELEPLVRVACEPQLATSHQPSAHVFAFGAAFRLLITAQRLSGALSSAEADAWGEWYRRHERHRVDAVQDPEDVWPARIDVVQMLRHHLRHPRSFWHTIVLNR